jgi:putative membrane protein
MFEHMFNTLPHFLAYFGLAVVLAVGFVAAYVSITPHREFALIREGNTAASLQLIGTFAGWSLPMAVVISYSVNLADMLAWGLVTLVTQVLVFFVISRAFKGIEDRIREKCNASGVFIGGMSFCFGILQAGCLVP